MGHQRGFKSTLTLIQEATFLTSPGTGQIVPIISHTLKSEANLVTPETITGRRDPQAPLDGYKKMGGDIVFPLELGNLATWLTMAFGQTASPWKIQDSVPTFQVIDNLPDLSKSVMYNGCKVSKLHFEFGGDAQLKATATLVGCKETVSANVTDGTAVAALMQITQAGLILKEAGTQTGVVTKMTLDVDFGLDDLQYPIGGGAIASEILDGMVKVSGNVTALLSDDTLWLKARNGTETSFQVVGTFGTSTLTIDIQEARLDQPTKDLTGPKGRLIEFPFIAYYDNAGTDKSTIQFAIDDGASPSP